MADRFLRSSHSRITSYNVCYTKLLRGARRLSAVISVIGPHEEEAEHLKRAVEGLGYEAAITLSYTNHSNMAHAGPDFYDIGYIAHID